MNRSLSDELEQAFRTYVRSVVRDAVAEELAAFRALLSPHPIADNSPLLHAEEVARLLGADTSTAEATRRACQHVYYLAKHRGLPAVRLGPKSIMFDRAKVEKWLADRST